MLAAVSALDEHKVISLFLVRPSLSQMKPPQGGTLLHHLIREHCDRDHEEVREMIEIFRCWGVDFSASDDFGKKAYEYTTKDETIRLTKRM